ncbi:MAG: histidinol-phosphatase HisJ family protein [Anaerolineae bacterium]
MAPRLQRLGCSPRPCGFSCRPTLPKVSSANDRKFCDHREQNRQRMIDTHTHSHHSPDGTGSMADMVQAAQAIGLDGIVFTEHAEWYPGDEAYGYLDMAAYFEELNAVRSSLKDGFGVFAGVELGNPHDFPDLASSLLEKWPFDLVIGSVHWLDSMPGWQSEIFEQGLEATYCRYFEEVIVMVENAEFDVLGHLDLVRRDSWELFGRVLDLKPYRNAIDHILRRVIEKGKGIEVNTSGLRKGLSEPVPGLGILRQYRSLGGEILVFGSDGHRSEHVGHGFDVARDLALAAGFERIARFEQRRVAGWIDL